MPLGKQSFTAKELAHSEWFGCGRHLLVDFSSRWTRTYFFDIAIVVSENADWRLFRDDQITVI